MPRGGSRPGAGRPPGSENRDTAAMRAALSDLASEHVEVALGALADIAANGQSEAARVSASCAILDRVYGRPRQAVEHEGADGGELTTVTRVIIEPETQAALDAFSARLSRLRDADRSDNVKP